MLKRVELPSRAIDWITITKPFAIAAICLGTVSPAIAEQHPVHVAQRAKEESVLVATREAPGDVTNISSRESMPAGAGNVEECETLEPIAESSDYRPELAGDAQHSDAQHDDASTHFDDVLAKAATSKSSAAPTAPAKSEPRKFLEQETTSSSGSARRAASAHAIKVPFEPVKFQGISVAKTSKQDLVTAWGEPDDTTSTDDGNVLVYHKPPFKALEVLIGANDVVSSIKITLATPLESKQLAAQLGLDKLDPVLVTDQTNTAVAQAYPERGVMFMLDASETIAPIDGDSSSADEERHVAHVVVQPIDAQAFAYRAENRLQGPFAQNISDLKTAIALDPEFGRAYWLLAKIYLTTGEADLAETAAAEACDIEPKNASFQLCHAQTRELLGEYDDAVLAVRAVLDREDLTPIDKAEAFHRMARLASLGDKEIASKTIPFETKCIEIADKLAADKDTRERHHAKQLLVEAHVAIAEEVARQPYSEKVESLSQWIGRASGLAEEYIEKDNGSVELRLFIAQHALGALASFKPTLDPAPWISEAEEASKTLMAQSDDELWQQHIKWELGVAYLNGLRVEHTRRQTDSALKFGQLAIDNMSVGASSRQAVHSSEQMVGQLYFQMGAVYAVHKLDHTKAVQWYEKAAPLISSKRPASELYAPRREGEMLVSMGVSYWQVGNQARALDLTQSGVGLVEAAVQGGVLAKSTLAVPYSNLSSMYQQMGENTNAAKYAKLAKSIETTEAADQPQQPRIGRTPTSQTHHTRSR